MRKMTKHKVRAAGFREIIKRHHGNVRDALNTEPFREDQENNA